MIVVTFMKINSLRSIETFVTVYHTTRHNAPENLIIHSIAVKTTGLERQVTLNWLIQILFIYCQKCLYKRNYSQLCKRKNNCRVKSQVK